MGYLGHRRRKLRPFVSAVAAKDRKMFRDFLAEVAVTITNCYWREKVVDGDREDRGM